MLNEETIQNFTRNIHELWIKPELDKRRAEGRIPENFLIYRYMVKLPKDRPPIVEFNEEVRWVVKAKLGSGEPFVGDGAFLHDIAEIVSVNPPEIDGNRVAFIFIWWNGHEFEGVFDFSPNWDPGELPAGSDSWTYGGVIAQYLRSRLTELTIHVHDSLERQLRHIGLWAVPALLPYPLSEICRLVQAGQLPAAREILSSHCTVEFIRGLVSTWWDMRLFADRRTLIEQSLQAHESGHYALSVSTLLPHTEGVITDWEYDLNLKNETISFRAESKTKKFESIARKTGRISEQSATTGRISW